MVQTGKAPEHVIYSREAASQAAAPARISDSGLKRKKDEDN